MTPGERMRALAAKEADSETFRADYEACKAALRADGWADEHIEELQLILKVDLADGPGVERPFPMALAERREGWRNWFRARAVAPGDAGINERIRERIKIDHQTADLASKELN